MPGAVADVAALGMVHLPKRPNGELIDWSAPLRDAWDISESGALSIMEQFMSEGGSMPAASHTALGAGTDVESDEPLYHVLQLRGSVLFSMSLPA